ncbi:AarF/ABC1/UbiB kinase family protein [Streptomyces sp. ISL-11]|uniref:ABC1 kinase family protein n=1 Tax=Streptomyces sp. ISL-11 TaxID=2819174 RepID=UPI001BECA12D|nr:AarF/UbiB family protein [Streptomyces sp. ISL-11]MBT2384963.1 AarF/ABC1/UbiB kinase family protein [Streptomyces sp. ISL-11]
MLSTRPDLVSATVISELEKLHDQALVLPFSDMETVLEEEFGRSWRNRFSFIDTQNPLGTASLAQTYRAGLTTGETVVVKIQRPGIQAVMDDDMRMMRRSARIIAKGAPRFDATIGIETMLSVIFDAMRPELDFQVEAHNMDAARPMASTFDRLSVPYAVDATRRVLIQTPAPGKSIRDVDLDDFKDTDRIAIGQDLLAFMYRGYFVENFFHADPHPGNIFIDPDEGATIIDWGMVGRVDRGMSMSLALILICIAENDGLGAAKAWIEMGNPTAWANLTGFVTDISILVPKIAKATLGELNFGTILTEALKSSTKRGIQTSPMVSILGKSFANIDGSIRYLAPEIAVTEVFTRELSGILRHFALGALSEGQAARAALDLIISAGTAPTDSRQILRDLANQKLGIHITALHQRSRIPGARSDESPRLLLLAVAALVYHALRERRR